MTTTDRPSLPQVEAGPSPTRRFSRWQMAVGAAAAVVVLWVGGDLLEITTGGPPDRGGTSPPAAHDPSSFDHGRP